MLNIFNSVFGSILFIDPDIIETIEIAYDLKVTFYDASYIQLAKEEN